MKYVSIDVHDAASPCVVHFVVAATATSHVHLALHFLLGLDSFGWEGAGLQLLQMWSFCSLDDTVHDHSLLGLK